MLLGAVKEEMHFNDPIGIILAFAFYVVLYSRIMQPLELTGVPE